LFALSLATVAVNDCFCPACTDAAVGDSTTATATVAGSEELERDPPPHPLANAKPTIANVDKPRVARAVCTRVKAVSTFLLFLVF
jgi:hypothetical protein